jgi:GTPase SAR1 family protein
MGLEKLGSLTSNYYRGASCILLMFSIDDASSLDQLDDIMTESFTYSNYDNCHLVLVATKCDKKSEIDQGTIESRRIKHDLKLYIISSKNNQGIDTLLDDVARMVKTRKTGTIRLGSYPNITKTSGSCSC